MKNNQIMWESIEPNLTEEGLMQTPFGTFKINHCMNPLKHVTFFIAYTNFKINKDVLRVLLSVDGIDFLQIISPYSMIVGCAKLFSPNVLKKKINYVLCSKNETRKISEKALIKLKQITKVQDQKYWCLYLFPNLKIDSFGTENYEEYKERLIFYKQCVNYSGGLIRTYEDY